MSTQPVTAKAAPATMPQPSGPRPPPAAPARPSELRETFDQFLGEVFFGQMLKAMRKTVGKPAYFHGGRAEEIFTQQLDQVLAEKLAETSASSFSGPMFELFQMRTG